MTSEMTGENALRPAIKVAANSRVDFSVFEDRGAASERRHLLSNVMSGWSSENMLCESNKSYKITWAKWSPVTWTASCTGSSEMSAAGEGGDIRAQGGWSSFAFILSEFNPGCACVLVRITRLKILLYCLKVLHWICGSFFPSIYH